MNRIPSFLRSAAVLALVAGFACSALADEVRVLAAAAFQPVVTAIAPAFEKRTGHKLALVAGTGGALAERIRGGEDFDLAVLPQPLLEALGKEGAVSDGSIIALARGRAERQDATVYAGAVSTSASNSQAALSLLILLASEETQAVLKNSGLAAP
ncbi:molybdate ABC transporter substrate-binding protein [Ramlibacter sp. AN1133]|uniref:molybdate ABC transporter substrate-binding protein n=1 Tax=Ramlibacter sp. AN1133 TaxID=3133429 RepID=UPI0030C18107